MSWTNMVKTNKIFRDNIAEANLAKVMRGCSINLADAKVLQQQALVAQLKEEG